MSMLLAWQHVCLQHTNSSWQTRCPGHDHMSCSNVKIAHTHLLHTDSVSLIALCLQLTDRWLLTWLWLPKRPCYYPVMSISCISHFGSFFRHSSGLKVYHRSHSLCPVSPVAAGSYRIVYFLWSACFYYKFPKLLNWFDHLGRIQPPGRGIYSKNMFPLYMLLFTVLCVSFHCFLSPTLFYMIMFTLWKVVEWDFVYNLQKCTCLLQTPQHWFDHSEGKLYQAAYECNPDSSDQ